MSTARAATYREQRTARHLAEVGRGDHDDECEVRPDAGYWLCHCQKRSREASGYTQLPGDLDWPPPNCPRCWRRVDHDGDSWTCRECHVSWSNDGTGAMWTDDYGTLSPPVSPTG